jgi:hypothetical protein
VVSYETQLAGAEPLPQRNEQPTPQQSAVEGLRREDAQHFELVHHPETGALMGMLPRSGSPAQNPGQNPGQTSNPSDRNAMMERLSSMAESLARPRKVVRDANGRIIGLT